MTSVINGHSLTPCAENSGDWSSTGSDYFSSSNQRLRIVTRETRHRPTALTRNQNPCYVLSANFASSPTRQASQLPSVQMRKSVFFCNGWLVRVLCEVFSCWGGYQFCSRAGCPRGHEVL